MRPPSTTGLIPAAATQPSRIVAAPLSVTLCRCAVQSAGPGVGHPHNRAVTRDDARAMTGDAVHDGAGRRVVDGGAGLFVGRAQTGHRDVVALEAGRDARVRRRDGQGRRTGLQVDDA